MRRKFWAGLIVAGSLYISLAGPRPALAADVAAPMFTKAPIASLPNWTGFYLGANVGYGIGRNPSTTSFPGFFGISNPTESYMQVPAGALGGFQAGYDLQAGPMVFGIEGDWQWSAQHTSTCGFVCTDEGAVIAEQRLRSFGTLRGRLGVSAGSSLLYGTAGLAWADVNTDINLTNTFNNLSDRASFHHTMSGWTAGGGIETAIGGNWTAKVEYLYADFGSVTDAFYSPTFAHVTQVTSDLHEHIVRAGINYRFNGPVASGAAAATPWQALQARLVNWSGAYVGGNIGYGIGENRSELAQTVDPALVPETFTMSPGGVIGGVQAGYNWQADHIVAGIEADFQGTGQKDSVCMQSCEFPLHGGVTAQQSQSWFATVRGRIGYAAGSSLLYATGGYAAANIKTSFQTLSFGVTTPVTLNAMRSGWTAGAGIETMIAPNWSTKLEYLYTDYGNISSGFVPTGPFISTSLSSDLHDHVVRAGVNYHFGG